jgi:hypothetical protein
MRIAHSAWAAGLLLAVSCAIAPAAEVQVEAVLGQPLGVGRVSARVLESEGLSVADADGRTLYLASDSPPPVRRLLRDLIGNLVPVQRPKTVNAYFLFVGDEPLELHVSAGRQPIQVVPGRSPESHDQLLGEWWRAYSRQPGMLEEQDDLPELKNYLSAMLSRRLDLPLPEQRAGLLDGMWTDVFSTLMSVTEDDRLEQLRSLTLATPAAESADQPLPETASAAGELPVPGDALPEGQEIEALASHVPVECFYVRFGSFTNFLWFGDTMERAGGDMTNLITIRGLDRRIRERVETQISMRQWSLARVGGDLAIADMALVGLDPFVNDGAAVGVVLEGRGDGSGAVAEIERQWTEALDKHPDATRTRVEVAGHEVELLSTPDWRIRSYHAVDGPFHLLTTSQTIVRRFYEAGAGQGSLAASPAFLQARLDVPTERRDAIWAHFSAEFFQQLAGPHCRIEAQRRSRSAAELELVLLARLAAQGEGRPAETLADLVSGGYLPERFGERADGSQIVLAGGAASDSLRGLRGSFVPVADMEIEGITETELRDYERFASQYRQKVDRLEPMTVAVERRLREGGRVERLTMRMRMAPLSDTLYGELADLLGPAQSRRVKPIEGDVVTFDAVLGEDRIFGGARRLPAEEEDGWAIPPALTRRPVVNFLLAHPSDVIVGYLGTNRGSEALGFFRNRPYEPADSEGYARSLGPLWTQDLLEVFRDALSGGPVQLDGLLEGDQGLWRRQTDDFTTYAFRGDVLRDVTPQLEYEDLERPGQLWLRAEDLNGTQLGALVNVLSYVAARRTEETNTRFLNSLIEQVQAHPEECLAAAEAMLDARLVSPLAGRYELQDTPRGPRWTSTALDAATDEGVVPAGYRSPPLVWFRGLDLEARFDRDAAEVRATIDMQVDELDAERERREGAGEGEEQSGGESTTTN